MLLALSLLWNNVGTVPLLWYVVGTAPFLWYIVGNVPLLWYFWHCPITVICCFALSHYCPIMVRNYLSFAILLLLLYYLTHFHAGIIPLVINLEALYLHYKITHTVCVLRDTSWYCRITVLYTLSHYRQMALMLCHHDAMSCCSESLHLVIDTSSVFVYWFWWLDSTSLLSFWCGI